VKPYSVDHIGIAVRSLDEALRFYRDHLQIEVAGEEEVPTEKVRLAMLPLGETRIELLEATAEDSPIAKFIDKRGEGLHHIAVKVENLTAVLERLKAAGVRLINQEPGVGAGGHLYAFVHPHSAGGVLLELVEDEPKGV
jgi:methylmalonyl-CoA/ethylmalonyl-CoA epimerase